MPTNLAERGAGASSDAELLGWEGEGGALPRLTRAATLHELRVRIAAATMRRDLLSVRSAPERYLAEDSILSALEMQLAMCLRGREGKPGGSGP